MRCFTRMAIGFAVSILAGAGWSDEPVLKLNFNGATLETNQVTVQGAGFGAYPLADVSFGEIPSDNFFEGATDGLGLIIQAGPGEGVMVFAPKITLGEAAFIRCTVRTAQPHAAVVIAAVGEKPNAFISQNTPDDPSYFMSQYLRLSLMSLPPSNGIQPLIQVLNTSGTESLTAYLDNFEVYSINRTRYFSGEFLNGDESDPPSDRISLPADDGTGAIPPGESGSPLTLTLNNVSLEMVYMAPGSFWMGSPDNEYGRSTNEGPQHRVTLTKGFYIGRYEVTQEQWAATMINNPVSYMSEGYGWKKPVTQVSWNDCQAFITQLNQLGMGTFRLPTEAEWEYACRAGTDTRYYWGDDRSSWGSGSVGQYVWFVGNSNGFPRQVGLKKSNSWGLYDMSGNVWEMCQDWWMDSYPADSQTDPTGPASGEMKVMRGGYFSDQASRCRSAARSSTDLTGKYGAIGLRLVREP